MQVIVVFMRPPRNLLLYHLPTKPRILRTINLNKGSCHKIMTNDAEGSSTAVIVSFNYFKVRRFC